MEKRLSKNFLPSSLQEKNADSPQNLDISRFCGLQFVSEFPSVFYPFFEFARIFFILPRASLFFAKSMPNALPMMSAISER